MQLRNSNSAYDPVVASLAHSRFFDGTSSLTYNARLIDVPERPSLESPLQPSDPGDDTLGGGNFSALFGLSIEDTTSADFVAARGWQSVLNRRPLSRRDRGLMDIELQLSDYIHLDPDWDGYGGVAPSRAAVADAVRFLRLLDHEVPLPFPQVSGDGSVGIYWEGDDFLIDVGFRGLGQISYFARHGNRRWKGDDPFRGNDIPKQLFEAISAILRR
ncbi:MAG: hypothetical protein RLO51_26170 [Thalassobaculum sp.]|uniref:hypothetical protein n=1 Tax=Thalassobaculum sp. TaxID=2022740 RepID=UPI0032EDDABB